MVIEDGGVNMGEKDNSLIKKQKKQLYASYRHHFVVVAVIVNHP